jgi:hypothetical protein
MQACNNGIKRKAQDLYCYSIPSIPGIWHSPYIEGRVTQSLRRMIDTPRGLHGEDAIRTWGMIIIPEDIYRYLILVDVVETARFRD